MEDWRRCLDFLGIRYPKNKNEFNIRCPLHRDSNPSCSINVSKGVWICHTGCGKGSLRSLAKRMVNISDSEIDAIIGKVITFNDIHFSTETIVEVDESDVLKPINNIPFPLGEVPQFIYDRGFSKEIMDYYKAGSNPYTGSFILPIYHPLGLVGWFARANSNQRIVSYNDGFLANKLIFNQDILGFKRIDKLCLTEGPLDAIWMCQHGFYAAALFGASMSDEQADIINQLDIGELVLCFDNDEAGRIVTKQVKERFANNKIVSTALIPPGYKDVQDIRNPYELEKAVTNRYEFEF